MKTELSANGVKWLLNQSAHRWIEQLPLAGAAALEQGISDGTVSIGADERTISASAAFAANLNESAAQTLGLPPVSPLGFDIRLSGVMGRPGSSLAIRWLQPGKTLLARDAESAGPWVLWQGMSYRIPGAMFRAMELANAFNQVPSDDIDQQFRVWAQIRAALGDEAASDVTDSFLRSFRVISASAMTWALNTDAKGHLQLDPILLVEQTSSDGQASSLEHALTDADEAVFCRRLDELRAGASAFPLANGTYVVVSDELQVALQKVKELRRAPAEQRQQAALRPEAVLREMLGLDEAAETVFVETEKYADRVRDISEWEEPIVPWIKIASQNWDAPMAQGIRIGGVELPLDEGKLTSACQKMRDAVAQGATEIELDGLRVPANSSNLAALEKLERAISRRNNRSGGKDPGTDDGPESGPSVLIIETNHQDAAYQCVRVAQRPGRPALPEGLKTSPKKHQEFCVTWLQAHWNKGSKGAMLCDDMGLGKTFQSLAFLRWLAELMDAGVVERRPLLVIAPVGLLRNWEAEIESHLLAPGLGDLVRAYGDHLKVLRRGMHQDGSASLDTTRLASAGLVLANYEAVSDYQLSFGRVRFAAVVLDEAQKVKSPKARMTHAVKGLNADFVVAMTGTPVENRLADLWCIADTVQPGVLGDLKEFSQRFEREGADVGSLRDMLWQEEEAFDAETPKILLRRLKSDKLDGLPPKTEHVIRKQMPVPQLEAYGRALAIKEVGGAEAALAMIHGLRRASLHPILADGGATPGGDLRVEDSARMEGLVEVLDQVHKHGEKALVFVEALDLQGADQLPSLLKRRYNMSRLPSVINGEVSAEARQKIVDHFQRAEGFDVMLLSPKAGGVGLTLTAANHVIHLSRWWNPAVEDQCSDRVYRIGQHRPVHIYYPLAVLPSNEDASFDMQLQQLMNRKRSLAQGLLVAPAFSKKDFSDLLQAVNLS